MNIKSLLWKNERVYGINGINKEFPVSLYGYQRNELSITHFFERI